MSDTVYKIFPRYYFPKYTDAQICGAVETLKIYSKENISFANFKKVQFIDCGEGLEHIFCPWCGSEVGTDLWQELMDKAYSGNSFES